MSRVGLFGGTFDPVHEGHLALAAACAEQLSLDEVRFLPARIPPHKGAATVSGEHRLAMLELATADRSDFRPDPRELSREGTSYTIDTLIELGEELPDAELFFLCGADSLRDLPTWRRWEELLQRAVFVVVGRSGIDHDPLVERHRAEIEAGRIVLLSCEPPPWASREIRAALEAGQRPEGLPPSVSDYIQERGLYREDPTEEASVTESATELPTDVAELLDLVHDAAASKLAKHPVAFDLTGLTTMTDAIYVCHQDNRAAVEAITDEIRRRLKQSGRKVPRSEGDGHEPQWILLDLGGLMVHVFRAEAREFYSLERLWSDGRKITLGDP
ncbi:MAG: nicotinate-nucleotide adenylyltransferase [Acidobacteriota bacterium]